MWQVIGAMSKACAMISSSVFLFEWCTATYNAWSMKSEILAYDPSYCKTHYDVCLEIGIMECFTIFLGPLLFLKIVEYIVCDLLPSCSRFLERIYCLGRHVPQPDLQVVLDSTDTKADPPPTPCKIQPAE